MSTWLGSIEGKAKEEIVEEFDKIQKPECQLTHLGLKDVTRKSVCMASTLTVKNPYEHDLPVFSISYRITSHSKEVGYGELTDGVDPIKGKGNTDIELPTTVDNDFLWNLVKEIGSDWAIDYTFDVKVQFQLPIVGKFTIPLDHSGTIKLPTLSELL